MSKFQRYFILSLKLKPYLQVWVFSNTHRSVMLIFGKNASFFVWNSSCEFKGSHTDAEKSDQNKKACSYFAFQFNISENWQHAASLSPRFVTPTWLLVVLADVFRCSELCRVAAEWGISTPDPSGVRQQMHVLFICSPPTSMLPSFGLWPSPGSDCLDFFCNRWNAPCVIVF